MGKNGSKAAEILKISKKKIENILKSMITATKQNLLTKTAISLDFKGKTGSFKILDPLARQTDNI